MAAEKEDHGTEKKEKKQVSRRGFLKTAAAGAAAAGFAVTVPRLLTGDSALPSLFDRAPTGASGKPIVAYIGDSRTGEIVLMTEEREVRIQDFGMVSSLVRAVSGL